MKELTLEITQKCLNKCIYCSSMSSYNSKEFLPYSICSNVIEDAVDLGFNQFNISGGEPFLHPQILDIIKRCKEYKSKVVIYSSGLIPLDISEKIENSNCFKSIPRETFRICKSLHVDKIIFNMQCDSDYLHANITGIKQTKTVRNNSILNATDEGLDVEVNIVPMKINLDEIETTTLNALSLGCKNVNFLGLVMQGRALENKDKIAMDSVDYALLHNKLKDLKDNYGNKIRIGNPLNNTPERCNAGAGKIVVRYDGKVFPCEAFKSCNELCNYEPLSVREYRLEYILKNSLYLKAAQNFIIENKKSNCINCPAQQKSQYHCALDTETLKNTPNFLAAEYQDSKDIFISSMKGYLADNFPELIIKKVNNSSLDNDIKHEFFKKNYLLMNDSAYDVANTSHILIAKDSNEIKAMACDRIPISSWYYANLANGNLNNMLDYDFCKYAEKQNYLYLDPLFISNIVDLKTKKKFLSDYLDNATYPEKDYIKYNIAIALNDDFRIALIDKGFKEVKQCGFYKVFVYITASQFCRENIYCKK